MDNGLGHPKIIYCNALGKLKCLGFEVSYCAQMTCSPKVYWRSSNRITLTGVICPDDPNYLRCDRDS